MAYVRIGRDDSTLGYFGCGPQCSCGSCRRGRLGEWYIEDEEDREPPPKPAKAPPKIAPAQAKPTRDSGGPPRSGPPAEPLEGWDSYGRGLGEAGPSSRVVFVPGIMGSKLADRSDGKVLFGDAQMSQWLTRPHDWVARMSQGNGIDLAGNVVPAELTRINLPGQAFDVDPYGPLIASLINRLGSSNVLICDYDWRLSNETSALRLKRLVESAWPDAAGDPSRRGTVVAHSMGGLIARWYIERLDGHRFVSRLVTVGTPHHGAADALKVLLEIGGAAALATLTSFITLPGAVSALLGVLGPLLRELQRMLSGFASVYQLMPDFDFVFPSPLASTMEPIATTFDKLRNSRALDPALGPPGGGRSLIRGPRTGELRRLNDGLTRNVPALPALLRGRGVTYVPVAGFVLDTVVALRNTGGTSFAPLLSRCGDGTVSWRSAALPAGPQVRTLFTNSSVKHSNLFRDPAIQRLCLNVITGVPNLTAGAQAAFRPMAPACPPPRTGIPAPPAIPLPPTPGQALRWAQEQARRAAQRLVR